MKFPCLICAETLMKWGPESAQAQHHDEHRAPNGRTRCQTGAAGATDNCEGLARTSAQRPAASDLVLPFALLDANVNLAPAPLR